MQWVSLSYLAERRAILIAEKQRSLIFPIFLRGRLKQLIPFSLCGDDEC